MSLWRRLNGPMSERTQDVVAIAGLLLFGLSGFIDRADGLEFGRIKLIFLVLGIIALGKFLLHGRLIGRTKPSHGKDSNAAS